MKFTNGAQELTYGRLQTYLSGSLFASTMRARDDQPSFDLIMDANAVVFRFGSAEISRESGRTLDKIMAGTATCADTLVFELGGHTDNTGRRDANLVLSQARAQAVANYMRDAGFDVARLVVTGYGPDQPESDNATPEGRAANRRIEFSVQERSE